MMVSESKQENKFQPIVFEKFKVSFVNPKISQDFIVPNKIYDLQFSLFPSKANKLQNEEFYIFDALFFMNIKDVQKADI